jgi:monothiol glutaredoxin
MKIMAYIRPDCRWSESVCEILDKYGLEYKKLDVKADGGAYDEMVRKSGQNHVPCVEIDGIMLADVSGEEVENYLLSHELVQAVSYDEANESKDREKGEENVIYFKLSPPTKFF